MGIYETKKSAYRSRSPGASLTMEPTFSIEITNEIRSWQGLPPIKVDEEENLSVEKDVEEADETEEPYNAHKDLGY